MKPKAALVDVPKLLTVLRYAVVVDAMLIRRHPTFHVRVFPAGVSVKPIWPIYAPLPGVPGSVALDVFIQA